MEKKTLLGLTLDELKDVARQLGMPAFTGSQIAKWIYERRVKSIDEMTNISKGNRAKLAESYEIGCMAPIESRHSKDGTVKYLFPVRTTDGDTSRKRFVETVYIPEEGGHATLCVSCEVGCKMNCLFCQTGKQGFHGYLTVADILNQAYSIPEADSLTNIVYMRSTQILTAPYGWAWSPKRITVSSVGLKDKLQRFLNESDCQVAISLHSPIHEQREKLMPAEKGLAIKDVVDLLRDYDFSHQRRLTFEYIVFGGLNDSQTHAREICRLLKGLDCHVNLIRFHQIPNVPLHGASPERMETFRDYLTAHGFYCTIRASRGQDIEAACGLLSTKRQQAE